MTIEAIFSDHRGQRVRFPLTGATTPESIEDAHPELRFELVSMTVNSETFAAHDELSRQPRGQAIPYYDVEAFDAY